MSDLREGKYYTYVLLDSRNFGEFVYGDYKFEYEPFYVGKGYGRRIKRHLSKSNYNNDVTHKNRRVKFLIENNYEIKLIKVKENLTESEAFSLEMEMIKIIGRLDKKMGPLCNHTDGGEGSSGSKRKTKGKTLEEIYGVERAEEIKRNLSLGQLHGREKKVYVKTGRLKPNSTKGKTLEEIHGIEKAKELKEIIIKNLKLVKKGDKLTDGTKEKIVKSLIGNKRRLGIKCSKETKDKISKNKMGTVSWNATPIIQLSKDGDFISEWRSASNAAEILNLNQGNICSVINGNRKTCGGFKWILKELYNEK